MKLTTIRVMFIALTLLQAMMDTVYGGDSQTVAVSCIIPVIPGVNAPLNNGEQLLKTQEEANPKETPVWLQQDTQTTQTQGGDEKTELIATKTFYSR